MIESNKWYGTIKKQFIKVLFIRHVRFVDSLHDFETIETLCRWVYQVVDNPLDRELFPKTVQSLIWVLIKYS